MSTAVTGAGTGASSNHNPPRAKGANGAYGAAIDAQLLELAYADPDSVLATLGSNRSGLTDDEVEARRDAVRPQ